MQDEFGALRWVDDDDPAEIYWDNSVWAGMPDSTISLSAHLSDPGNEEGISLIGKNTTLGPPFIALYNPIGHG